MYPLKFTPVYQERIWGGTGLAQEFGRKLPSDHIGESWEISAHPNGLSLVSNGPLAGENIPQLIGDFGTAFLGVKAPSQAFERFPLLIKLLDANDQLSVQVHPGNAYALEHEGEPGKYEIWYVLSAKPGAKIVYGLKNGIDKATFQQALATGDLEACLNEIPVKAGEVYTIPPGLVHGLGAGIMVAEVQQNSDTVYRVYDYNRVDQSGKTRALHLEKALDVIRFDDFLPKYPLPPIPNSRLIDSEFFKIDYCVINDGVINDDNINNNSDINDGLESFNNVRTRSAKKHYYNDGSRFYILTNLSGRAQFDSEASTEAGRILEWNRGESLLIPADLAEFTINGPVTFLKTYLP